jgi:hypothetical protein
VVAPYAGLLIAAHPSAAAYLASHEATTLTIGAVLAIASGFLIESVGSYVEYYLIDRRHPNRDAMLDAWWRYLRVAWTTEPTGQHYLRRILAVFKFELNACVAVLAGLPGLLRAGQVGLLATSTWIALVLAAVLAAAYLFHAATQSSLLLATIREQLLKGVGEPPFTTTTERIGE